MLDNCISIVDVLGRERGSQESCDPDPRIDNLACSHPRFNISIPGMSPAVNITPVFCQPTGKQIPHGQLPRFSCLPRLCVCLILFSLSSPAAFGVLEDSQCHDALSDASGVPHLLCFVLFSAISLCFLFIYSLFISFSPSVVFFNILPTMRFKRTSCHKEHAGNVTHFPGLLAFKFAL